MNTSINRRAFVGAALSLGALCALSPSQAFAVTAAQKQAEVRSVKAQLDAMADDVSAAGDKYHQAMDAYQDASAKVEECQATIAAMTEKIGNLQDRLDVRATAMYRSGGMSYLDVLLGVRSFDDFATVWDTLNALNAEDADLVASTKVAKATLESAEGELVEQQERAAAQLSSAESYMNQVLAKQSEYDAIYNSLNAEYKQILAEQEAIDAQASARATHKITPTAPATVVAPTAAAPAPAAEAPGITTDGDVAATPESSGSTIEEQSSSYTDVSAPSLPTNDSVVDYAYSKLGCDYVWGSDGPDSFDCSGLVAWCYAQIGITLPHYTESLYESAAARFSPDEAEAGDILYKPGHVGISTGGLNCIEAMGTRWGVVESCRGGWTAALRF